MRGNTLSDNGDPPSYGYLSTALLQPVVETALAVFGAAASSILIIDHDNECLVFGAVAGAGEKTLVGRRFALETGFAGWVVASRESMRCDDLTDNRTFSRSVAEATGYVPQAMMAAPLVFGDECLGVLEVLDWTEGSRSELEDLAVLGRIADQAAVAVRMLALANPAADPFTDPKVADLCRLIIGWMADLSDEEVELRVKMLQSIVRSL